MNMGVPVPRCGWLSRGDVVPGRWDLRHLGWSVAAGRCDAGTPAILDWRTATRPRLWRAVADPAGVAVVGVDEPETRAALLRHGFGEALPTIVALVELAERLLRLATGPHALPRRRQAGPVTLDLFHRDGRIEDRWLGLHPREFGLLWRLAETPDRPVGRAELLGDVWRLAHMPETNSLEVHVSRLRAKLAVGGAGWLVATHPAGGYQLGRPGAASFLGFSRLRREALDSARTIGDGGRVAAAGRINQHASEPEGIDHA